MEEVESIKRWSKTSKGNSKIRAHKYYKHL